MDEPLRDGHLSEKAVAGRRGSVRRDVPFSSMHTNLSYGSASV